MLTIYEFGTRLIIAFLLGMAIGIERHWRQKSAGLRTNTLVSIGSASFILLSVLITGKDGDQTRVASQIVTGIGFLGAGVIMKEGLSIHGLNTAATIWCSAAVGSLAGIGLFLEATFTASMVILTHILLRALGNKLHQFTFSRPEISHTDYTFKIQCKKKAENHIRVLLIQYLNNEDKLILQSLTNNDFSDSAKSMIKAEIRSINSQDDLIEKITSILTVEEGILKISWKVVGQHSEP